MVDTSNARSEILARIRSIHERAAAQSAADAAWSMIPRKYRQVGTLDRESCTDLFVDRLQDYGAGVHRCAPFDLAKTVTLILRERQKKCVLVPLGLDPAWLERDCGCTFVTDRAFSYAEIDACDGVLTACNVAIAGTGTIVLCHDAGLGRRAATLIPDYHLCVVRASDIVETVPQAMQMLDRCKMQPITMISGPSATADIEMTRIQGVHGPRVLDVAIVV